MNLVADTIIQVDDRGSGPAIHAERIRDSEQIALTVAGPACRMRWYGTADQLKDLLGALVDAVDKADRDRVWT